MNKKCVLYIIFVFLSMGVINLFIIYRHHKVKNTLFEVIENNENWENYIHFYKYKEQIEINCISQQLNQNIFLEKKLWNNFIDKYKKEKILVLVYSKLHCNVCVEELIELIKANWDDSNKERIVLFVDYDQKRYSDIFKKINKIDFNTLRVDIAQINEIVPIKDLPFFMIIDNGIEIEKIFIPDKNDPTNTAIFLKFVNNYFLNHVPDA